MLCCDPWTGPGTSSRQQGRLGGGQELSGDLGTGLRSRRANAVRDFLIGQGVAAARIETISFGKERPIDGGSSEESWAKNRNGHTAITDGAR